MAIFGCFTDIPLPDVMSLIGSSTGVLTVSRYENQHVYLFGIQNAVITEVRFNGQEVGDHAQARSFITELIQTNHGEFEFERGKSLTGSHSLSINDVLNSSLSVIDEIQAFREHFPDPHTVFVASESGKGWLGSDLKAFWQTSQPYFQKGISALELHERLGLYLDQVLLKFYKLRTTGLIVPKRVFQGDSAPRDETPAAIPVEQPVVETPPAQPTPPKQDSIASEIDRLSLGLEPIFQKGSVVPKPQVETLATVLRSASPDEGNLKQITLSKPSKNVVKHLMKSIWEKISTKP